MAEFEGRLLIAHEFDDDEMRVVHAHRHIGGIAEAVLDVGESLPDALGDKQLDGKTGAVCDIELGEEAVDIPARTFAEQNVLEIFLPIRQHFARIGMRDEIGDELCPAFRLLPRTAEVCLRPLSAVRERELRLAAAAGDKRHLGARLFPDVFQEAGKLRPGLMRHMIFSPLYGGHTPDRAVPASYSG